MNFKRNKIKVYIKLNEDNFVTQINSSIFLKDISGWVEIDEGYGDKFSHAQNKYLPKGLIDEKGRFNYKYDENALIELDEELKDVLFPEPIPEPTELEKLDARLTYLEIMSEVA